MNSSALQWTSLSRRAAHFATLTTLLLGVLMIKSSITAKAANLALPVEPGETRLSEIGLAQVGWQSAGKEPVSMPPDWRGHFDETTGISCQDAGKILGREALLMHSPWRVSPGKTWVDYPLQLPKTTPIRLTFGIAMGPGRVGPKLSDGVTFSCFLTSGGKESELMRNHYAKEEWLDYAFDLPSRPSCLCLPNARLDCLKPFTIPRRRGLLPPQNRWHPQPAGRDRLYRCFT